MADRRRPYARTLAVLRVLSWPYRYPPLSWWVRLIDWAADSNRRLAVAFVLAVLAVAGTIVWKVTRG